MIARGECLGTLRDTRQDPFTVWNWKLHLEPPSELCLFSIKLLFFGFGNPHWCLNFCISVLSLVPSDSPDRSFSIAAGHVALNPAFSTQPQASPVFYRRPTPPAENISVPFCTAVAEGTITSRFDRRPCVASNKKIFNFLIWINLRVIWFSCRKHLQESPHIYTTHSRVLFVYSMQFCLFFTAIYCRFLKTFLTHTNQGRSTLTSNQMGTNDSFTRLRVISTSCLELPNFPCACCVIRIRGVAQCFVHSQDLM